MAEIDEVKERINFYKTAWTFVLAVLAGLVGWFMQYDKQDATSGLALVSIVLLIGLWVWLHLGILKLIRSLKDL